MKADDRKCIACGAPLNQFYKAESQGCWFWHKLVESLKAEGLSHRQIEEKLARLTVAPCETAVSSISMQAHRSLIFVFLFFMGVVLLSIWLASR